MTISKISSFRGCEAEPGIQSNLTTACKADFIYWILAFTQGHKRQYDEGFKPRHSGAAKQNPESNQ